MRRLRQSFRQSISLSNNRENILTLLLVSSRCSTITHPHVIPQSSVDFRLVDKENVCLFQYNHEVRCWEVVVADNRKPIRLKRSVKSTDLLALAPHFMQVNQKFIVNINYLIEVVDNVCHFYPPFDEIDYVKVGRLFRKRLIDRFLSI